MPTYADVCYRMLTYADAGEKPGNSIAPASAVAQASNDVETMMLAESIKSRGIRGASLQDSTGGGVTLWGQQGGGEDELMREDTSAGRACGGGGGGVTQQWTRQGAAVSSHSHSVGGEESDLHALSWMAPDFDLDDIL
jgi:hypothetical protein